MWKIIENYHHTLGFTPGKTAFGIYMLLNLTSIVGICVVTVRKKRQVDIDNVCEKSRQVKHDYTIGDIVYLENTGIKQKL